MREVEVHFGVWMSNCTSTISWKEFPFSIELLLHFVKNQLATLMWSYLRVLYLVPWIYVSKPLPIAHRLFFFFGHACVACRILAPLPGIEPGSSAVRVQSPDHWTTRVACHLDYCSYIMSWRHLNWLFLFTVSQKLCDLGLGNEFFLIFLFIYFWLHQVFVAVRGLSLVVVAGATLHCGAWASHCGGFSCCGAGALGAWASVLVACGLSSCGTRA